MRGAEHSRVTLNPGLTGTKWWRRRPDDDWRDDSQSSCCAGERRAHDHWITWSARNRIDCGIVSPSNLAVLRLITRSNLVGCSTGKSAALRLGAEFLLSATYHGHTISRRAVRLPHWSR